MIKYSAETQISSECAKIPSFQSHLHILQAIRHPTSPTPTQVDVSHWCTVFGGYVRCHLQFIPARKIHPLTVQYPKYNIYPGGFLLILIITFCSGPSPHIEGQQRTVPVELEPITSMLGTKYACHLQVRLLLPNWRSKKRTPR